MIRGAGPAKLVALSVALVVHGALAAALVSRETTEIEGADDGTEVRLGNAFADMAAGTLSSVSAEDAEVSAPETLDRLDAERAEPTPPDTAAMADKVSPADTARLVEAEPAPSELTVAAAQAVPVTHAEPLAVVQTALPAPDAAQVLQSPPVSERVEADASDSAAVARSLRPMRRSAEFEAAHKPEQVAKPKPQPTARPAPRPTPAPGNAERNARAGEATGQREAVAQQSGTAGRQQTAGNAAASNYPGLVMRKLSRAGKPRVNARGTAVIAFSIAANGGLSSVSLARSSGSAALDQAALRLVRGAGPFPKPPAGARRSFSIQIKGR
jgi:protein TonB|tara:strand:- start:921 stop:1901 length:981 start_codon:yes stop_codon:yes gene_type:complete